MWLDFIIEGLKNFAGEIIAVVLLIVALRYFRGLRRLFIKAKGLRGDEYFWGLCESCDAVKIEEAIMTIMSGVHINIHDSKGITPLMMVVLKGNAEVTELLLKHCADVNAKDLS